MLANESGKRWDVEVEESQGSGDFQKLLVKSKSPVNVNFAEAEKLVVANSIVLSKRDEEFNSVIQGGNRRRLPQAVKIRFLCNECGRKFTKKINPKAELYEVRCPKCGSYDIELD